MKVLSHKEQQRVCNRSTPVKSIAMLYAFYVNHMELLIYLYKGRSYEDEMRVNFFEFFENRIMR
jgi:hypothetical protein